MLFVDSGKQIAAFFQKCKQTADFCSQAEPTNNIRMDFDDMVKKMTQTSQQSKVCSCVDGYLPVYDEGSGALQRCHDPIIKVCGPYPASPGASQTL